MNVAQCFLFFTPQGPRPERPKESAPDISTTAAGETDLASIREEAGHGETRTSRPHQTQHDFHGMEDSEHDEEECGRRGEDSRPKLAPGVMLTLSSLAAEAIMVFTEEVRKSSLL